MGTVKARNKAPRRNCLRNSKALCFIKHVQLDILYLGIYTKDGRYLKCALFKMGIIQTGVV